MECSFCLQNFTDARKIPCGHIACMPCISQEVNTFGKIRCPTCRLEFKTGDVGSLEEIKFDPRKSALSNAELCNVCQEKMADVYCVTCQMALCSTHKEEDQVKADSIGDPAHYHVAMKQFMKNKERYKRHYCREHKDKLTSQACVRCAQVFCPTCNLQLKCPVTDEEHVLNSLSDSVKVIKDQIAELKAGLADKIARLLSIEKDALRKIEFMQKEEERLITEVNRTVKEQVDQITQEGEHLKAEISKYTQDFKELAEALTLNLTTTATKAREMIDALENVTNISVDGLLIEKYSNAREDFKEIASRNYLPIWTPSKQLVPAGTFRSLETRLEELFPCSMEYVNTVMTGDDIYYSVRWISADLLVTGSIDGIEMRDSKLRLIRSIRLEQCFDVVPYRDQLVVLHWLSPDNTYTIKLYSQTLEKIRDIVELPTKSNKLTQIAAADERIVASGPDEKCVYVYTFCGELLHEMDLSGMANPRGVCIAADGSLLVTDYALKGSVRKYQLRGDYSLIWQSDELLQPWGVVEHNNGLLYVNRHKANNSSLYQLSPEGRLLKELTCAELTTTKDTHGISVFGDSLAVACRDAGLKLFKFMYTP